METNNGWIKLHRKFTEWEWFTIPEMVQLYIFLLSKASHKQTRYRGYIIERGQLITSRTSIASELKLSEQVVRTCLKRLVSTNEISVKTNKHFTIITVCNYANYQNDAQLPNQKLTINPPMDTRQPDISENKNSVYFADNGELKNDVQKKILEFFFFKKCLKYPQEEYQRFFNHYSSVGWVNANGHSITNPIATSKNWKPHTDAPYNDLEQVKKWYHVYKHLQNIELINGFISAGLNESDILVLTCTEKLSRIIEDNSFSLRSVFEKVYSAKGLSYKIIKKTSTRQK